MLGPDVSRPAVAIAASFTVEPIEEPLRFWLETLALPLEPCFAPYHQVFQELLGPASSFGSNARGINVLLLRFEDYVRTPNLDTAAAEAKHLVQRTARELEQALSSFASRSRVPLVLCLFPVSPGAPLELREEIERATQAMAQAARGLPNVSVLEAADYAAYASAEQWDPSRDELAHIPFTESFFAAIAAALSRRIHALKVPSRKVLVLDCDNTLWQGVVGEDGIDGIRFDAPFLELQRFALAVQSKGVLLCLCSKNSEADALEVLEKRSDCLLRAEHIVSHRINWESKTSNLISLAQELNLGLDSFVFVDDSEIECGKVRAELPQVLTLDFRAAENVAHTLRNLWAFDKVTVTEEDRVRTQLYREDASRQKLERASANVADFVAGLGLEIDIDEPAESEWSRSSQLTQRTNQFNFTTLRLTEPELRGASSSGTSVLRVRVRDRFGDYGLVGLMLFRAVEAELRIENLLLSCRALGRGVEHRMLNHLGSIAEQRGLESVILRLVPTPKNEPARLFAESLGKAYRRERDAHIEYRLPSSIAASVRYEPEANTGAESNDSSGWDSTPAPSRPKPQDTGRSDCYCLIARELVTANAICEAVRARRVKPRGLDHAATPAANETEERLVRVWQQALGLSSIGTQDDYFELGGTSLLAVQIFSEIEREFEVRLPLTSIVEAPTIRRLAERLSSARSAPSDIAGAASLVELRRGTGTRCLFLVHDGDGESLLYRTLAHQLPSDISVFGIEPGSLGGVPLPYIRVEDMARDYVDLVRTKQAHGPYHLAGMCAGGTIAFAMAEMLEQAREDVALVAMLDAAAPSARLRSLLTTKRRWTRFAALADDAKGALDWKELGQRTNQAARKIKNLVRYEVKQRADVLSADARFWFLEEILERGISWPKWLPPLTVRQIYDRAAANYEPSKVRESRVVLFRASQGEGADEPFRKRYEDPALGWGAYTNADFEVVDVPGGHASMLQEPNVSVLARELERLLVPKVTALAIPDRSTPLQLMRQPGSLFRFDVRQNPEMLASKIPDGEELPHVHARSGNGSPELRSDPE